MRGRALILTAVLAALAGSAGWASASRTTLASRMHCASSVRGDFDGDGRSDVGLVGSARRDCRAGWTVTVRLASGSAPAHVLDKDAFPQVEDGRLCVVGCTAFAARDLTGDGRDELEVADDTPATGSIVVGYRLLRGSLRPLKARARSGAYHVMGFLHTGSVTYGSWVVCRDRPKAARRVIQISEGYATPRDHHVHISEDAYVVRGLVFRHLSTRTYRVRSNRVGEPVPVAGRPC